MSKMLAYIKENKSRLWPIVAVVFLILVSFLIQRANRTSQEIRSKAVADNGQLTFSASNTGPFSSGQTIDVAVNLNNGGQAVTGADIIVQFDKAKLTLQNITQNTTTNTVFKTYAPVDANGNFNTAKVISDANANGTVEFGIVSFDWSAGALTSPTPGNTILSPAATLRFAVKTAATSGTTMLTFKNDGINATTDSNIVVIASGVVEDILQPQPYANSTLALTVGSTGGPSPSPSVGLCTSVTCRDYTGDGIIFLQDLQRIANRWNQRTGDANYDSIYDLNCDGVIHLQDLQRQANFWNQSCAQ